jgi:hypothetical protein
MSSQYLVPFARVMEVPAFSDRKIIEFYHTSLFAISANLFVWKHLPRSRVEAFPEQIVICHLLSHVSNDQLDLVAFPRTVFLHGGRTICSGKAPTRLSSHVCRSLRKKKNVTTKKRRHIAALSSVTIFRAGKSMDHVFLGFVGNYLWS